MHDSFGRERWLWRLGAAAILVLAAAAALMVIRKDRIEWSGTPSGMTRIRVARFRADSVSGWGHGAMEDSIASQLSRSEIHVARVGGEDSDADYVVEGDVSPEDGRMVISLRLRPSGQRTPIWQATYWRNVAGDSSLVRDLAAAVDKALRSRRP